MRVSDVRFAAALGALALILSGCSSGTDAPVASTITITPATAVNFVSLNATATLHATVLDQRGDTMTGATVAWSTSDAGKATVDAASGLVTAKGNGTATITATSGDAHGDKTVTVAQVATSVVKTGDNQSGTVGSALANAISVHLTDAGGSAVVGASVLFVPSVGGSLGTPNATTNATGDAQTTWTLATVAGAQNVSVTSGTLNASFTATASAGATSAIAKQAGDNQQRVVSAPVATAPSVKVTDSFNNAKAGVPVVFAVTGGGGSIQGNTTINTNASGIATVGGWTMGGSAGANTLSATVQGTAITTSFTATAVTAGAPANIAVVVGNNQTALTGYRTNLRPAVVVTDAGGQPAAGVSVTFAVTGGGGSVTGATVNTNAVGVAQVGSWVVGGVAGANTMTATAAGGAIAGNPVNFAATGADPTYNITIQNIGPAFSPAVQSAFDSAVAHWQRIIYQDVPDQSLTLPANACVSGEPAYNALPVDDILIVAKVDSIDGPLGILGSAGFCVYRNPGTLLPYFGVMRFDSADMNLLQSNNQLKDVILHEMGHVLGFGTLWPNPIQVGFPGRGCLQSPSSAGAVTDAFFAVCGTAAGVAFDSLGGINYTGGNKVPVENCGGASPAGCGGGTINSHWREPTFGPELMTGYLNGGVVNPLSLMTIASMQDLGYVVNFAAADTYIRTFTSAPAMLAAPGPILELKGDIWLGPLYAGDPSGRLTRVR